MRDFGEATDVVLVGVQAPVGQEMNCGLRESIAEAFEESEESFLQKRRFSAGDSRYSGCPGMRSTMRRWSSRRCQARSGWLGAHDAVVLQET